MTKVAIDTSILGRKEPTILPVNIANVKKSLSYRGEIFDMNKNIRKFDGKDELDGSEVVEFLALDNEYMMKRIEVTLKFLKDLLVLSDDEFKDLQELDIDKIFSLADTINNKLMNPNNDNVESDDAKPSKPQ